jgi:proton glutamate symport protein
MSTQHQDQSGPSSDAEPGATPSVQQPPPTEHDGLALHWKILIGMAAGLIAGLSLNYLHAGGLVSNNVLRVVAGSGQAAGKLFLALLSMVVVPLVFTSLVSAVTGMRGQAELKRLGAATIGWYLLTSLLAIVLGIALSNLIRPGAGVDYHALMASGKGAGLEQLPVGAGDESVWEVVGGIVFRMVPGNVLDAARDNRNMLAVIFFAVVFGLFVNQVEHVRARRLADLIDDILAVMMRMTRGIISLAPWGIAGYMLYTTATTGVQMFAPLAKYMVTVALGLVVHAFVTLPTLMWVLTRKSPLAVARAVAPALATAFSTASSSGTLPLTIQCVESRAGVAPRYASFVLPLGATVNMDGTALYEAAAVLFVAQMLGDLTLGQQIIVALTALVASVGAAGIPHAGTVMMVIVLQAVGLPTDAVLAILAVDRILDMMRTTVNVWSDVTCSVVVSTMMERKRS